MLSCSNSSTIWPTDLPLFIGSRLAKSRMALRAAMNVSMAAASCASSKSSVPTSFRLYLTGRVYLRLPPLMFSFVMSSGFMISFFLSDSVT